MSASGDFQIGTLPVDALPAMMPHIAPMLSKGLGAAPNVSIEQEMSDAISGITKVWVVMKDAKVVAALFTSVVHDDDGTLALDVYGMGGDGIQKWGKPLSNVLADFAKSQGCKRAVFYGRKGLLRSYNGVRIIGQHDDRTMIFERVIQ